MRLDFCVACGRDHGLNHHHMVPRSIDGPDDESNLITLCRECHGLLHGADWSLDHADLIKRGLAAAKLRGVLPGRKSYVATMPETVALAKQLHADGLSYRKISAALAVQGHTTAKGKPHVASAIQKMIPRRGSVARTGAHLLGIARPSEGYPLYVTCPKSERIPRSTGR